MRKLLPVILLVGILGLWPFWFTVVWVVVTTLHAKNPQAYGSAAPWLIILSIPVCVATTLLALAANFVFHKSEGGLVRKIMLAAVVYIGIFVLLYANSGVDWLKEFGFRK
jgi:uncharacterized membrane protein YozB (DUF420 family)